MTLAYRGVKYERDSLPLEIKTGDIGGKYRGQDWNHHYPRHMIQLEPKLHRQYRGVAYSTRPHLAGQVTPNICPLPLVKPSVVVQEETLSSIHLNNIRHRLERRLQIAQESGDETLVNLLKKESQDLALNC
ncbi:DUF4278 domain-containing protein [Microcystis aeruginosa EAWAG127a]|jgi:hypothetical protein|uniref:DUF4278 domain-containing protein n=1 Tax=Microcystis aeruginosa EAWAG127a TaxID=2529855 RepID=A0A5J5LYS9_MICAE|nr:DUF4278 domain-containing protein [Microcystis aeruginosa]KAB0242822.1 DUF4278 domain-containing protein [Microcystis aeruginosa EAWAG127a]MDB9415476.1 DUF4278 domain-containing protein [Microcystis aeruginosa CS-556/03]